MWRMSLLSFWILLPATSSPTPPKVGAKQGQHFWPTFNDMASPTNWYTTTHKSLCMESSTKYARNKAFNKYAVHLMTLTKTQWSTIWTYLHVWWDPAPLHLRLRSWKVLGRRANTGDTHTNKDSTAKQMYTLRTYLRAKTGCHEPPHIRMWSLGLCGKGKKVKATTESGKNDIPGKISGSLPWYLQAVKSEQQRNNF